MSFHKTQEYSLKGGKSFEQINIWYYLKQINLKFYTG